MNKSAKNIKKNADYSGQKKVKSVTLRSKPYVATINQYFNTLLKSKKKNSKKLNSVGTVISITDGVAKISGLRKAKAMELLNFVNNIKGAALNIETTWIGAINFSSDKDIKQNDQVTRSFSVIKLPVGEN